MAVLINTDGSTPHQLVHSGKMGYMYTSLKRWCGVAWRGVAWRGVAWRGVAWRGVAWRGVAWRGVAWRGVAWRGVAWRGVAVLIKADGWRVERPGSERDVSWSMRV